MMKTLVLVLVIIFASSVAWAQSCSDRTVDNKFVIVNGFLVDATVFDIETTYRGLEKCPNCRELNPFMRPFINSGRPAIYAVEMFIDTGIIYYSYKLKKGRNKWWWVAPVVVGTAHGIAGSSNLALSAKFLF